MVCLHDWANEIEGLAVLLYLGNDVHSPGLGLIRCRRRARDSGAEALNEIWSQAVVSLGAEGAELLDQSGGEGQVVGQDGPYLMARQDDLHCHVHVLAGHRYMSKPLLYGRPLLGLGALW